MRCDIPALNFAFDTLLPFYPHHRIFICPHIDVVHILHCRVCLLENRYGCSELHDSPPHSCARPPVFPHSFTHSPFHLFILCNNTQAHTHTNRHKMSTICFEMTNLLFFHTGNFQL